MASVDLFIIILDQNDNKPEFSRESYTVYIDELESNIVPKTIIRVTDNDKGVNSILNFSSARFSYRCSYKSPQASPVKSQNENPEKNFLK